MELTTYLAQLMQATAVTGVSLASLFLFACTTIGKPISGSTAAWLLFALTVAMTVLLYVPYFEQRQAFGSFQGWAQVGHGMMLLLLVTGIIVKSLWRQKELRRPDVTSQDEGDTA